MRPRGKKVGRLASPHQSEVEMLASQFPGLAPQRGHTRIFKASTLLQNPGYTAGIVGGDCEARSRAVQGCLADAPPGSGV